METLLIKNATVPVTMDDAHRRITDGGLFVRDNVIEAVGPTDTLPATADRVINAQGMLLLPGLVNTHHHLYQTLTRAVPAVQDAVLFKWLKTRKSGAEKRADTEIERIRAEIAAREAK